MHSEKELFYCRFSPPPPLLLLFSHLKEKPAFLSGKLCSGSVNRRQQKKQEHTKEHTENCNKLYSSVPSLAWGGECLSMEEEQQMVWKGAFLKVANQALYTSLFTPARSHHWCLKPNTYNLSHHPHVSCGFLSTTPVGCVFPQTSFHLIWNGSCG